MRKLPLLRYYTVFNVEQCDGIAAPDVGRVVNPIEECESIVRQIPNPPATEQDSRAWYRPSTDTVGMPARNAFHSAEEYYSTLFHELTHSTGHPKRVGREAIEKLNTFGYAKAAYISHNAHDFGSILKFIETTFDLPSLNYADAPADNLADCFVLTQSPHTFQMIPAALKAEHFIKDKRPPTDPDDD
ncbi:MAG: zincin-like metallopeptidase domain-containing protein [Candidatus Acidiferrales bacterium]